MNDESKSENQNDLSQEEMRESAMKLLKLTDLVDRYPAVVERRVTGLIFVLIGGGVSIITLVYTTLFGFFQALGLELISVVFFVVISLLVSFIIAFRLIVPLTKSYTSIEQEEDQSSWLVNVIWGAFAIIMVISSIYSFGTGQPLLFLIVVQIILAIGNLAIYLDMRKNPKSVDYSLSHLVFVLLVSLSLIPILALPELAFSVMILVDIGGLYAQGIYILMTAERILVQTMGRE